MNNDNLSLYSIFLAVVRAGSILEASKQLYISQPAVSKSIRKLEDNLHTTLFIRTSKGIRLTEDGSILYESIKNAFDYIKSGEDHIAMRNKPETGHIRIGASSTLCKYVLLPFLRKYTSAHPQINISIECQSTGNTTDMLSKGKIDVGLTAYSMQRSDIEYYTMGSIHDIFAASPGYIDNLASHASKANVLLLDKSNITRQFVDSHIPSDFLSEKNILEVDNMDLLIDFAKAGLGIGCVIKEFVRCELTEGLLTEYKKGLQKLPKREVCLAVSSKRPVTAPVRDFLDFINKNRMVPEMNILIQPEYGA